MAKCPAGRLKPANGGRTRGMRPPCGHLAGRGRPQCTAAWARDDIMAANTDKNRVQKEVSQLSSAPLWPTKGGP
jgi:hypothetical protein